VLFFKKNKKKLQRKIIRRFVVQQLLDADLVSSASRSENESTPLIEACRFNNEAVVRALLTHRKLHKSAVSVMLEQ
jgi:ankyrin repeat protein